MFCGRAELEIGRVPDDAGCIHITVQGTSTVTRCFDVHAGKNALLSMSRLPLGNDVFTADAYSGVCSAVVPAAVPIGQRRGWRET